MEFLSARKATGPSPPIHGETIPRVDAARRSAVLGAVPAGQRPSRLPVLPGGHSAGESAMTPAGRPATEPGASGLAGQTRSRAPSRRSSRPASDLLQRSCSCEGPTSSIAECGPCGAERRLRPAGAPGQVQATRVPPIVGEVISAPGRPLDPAVRTFFESHLNTDAAAVSAPSKPSPTADSPYIGAPGDYLEVEANRIASRVAEISPASEQDPGRGKRVDLSSVRIHADAQAAQSARDVGARAYAMGHHVVFGTAQYAPHAREGRRLLAHELAHVLQQGKAWQSPDARAAGILSRVPDDEGIDKTPPEYLYSTNCGWIDFGHADGSAAKRLLNDVHVASEKLRKESELQEAPPGAHVIEHDVPGRALRNECPRAYEPGEKESSARPNGPSLRTEAGPHYTNYFLLGFEVDQSEPSRFSAEVANLAKMLEGSPDASIELWGFSDCVGLEAQNRTLRVSRALAIKAMLPASLHARANVVTFAPVDHFVESNISREGRRANRSVALKVVSPLAPVPGSFSERSGTRKITVNFAKVDFQILAPLSLDEEQSVALSIFQNVSVLFETTQMSTDWIKKSAFSEEDLPSNIMGFYKSAHGVNIVEVCAVWDKQHSRDSLKGYQFKQNPTFKPLWLPTGGVWPTQFSTIRPEPPGRLWRTEKAGISVFGLGHEIVFPHGPAKIIK